MRNYIKYLKLIDCIFGNAINYNVNDITAFVNAVVDDNELKS